MCIHPAVQWSNGCSWLAQTEAVLQEIHPLGVVGGVYSHPGVASHDSCPHSDSPGLSQEITACKAEILTRSAAVSGRSPAYWHWAVKRPHFIRCHVSTPTALCVRFFKLLGTHN